MQEEDGSIQSRLNGQRHLWNDGEKIITCGYKSSIVHRTIRNENDIGTTINKRSTDDGSNIKKIGPIDSFMFVSTQIKGAKKQ